MKARFLVALGLVAGLVLAGCKSGITEEDTANMRQEFSEENYEKNMKAMGKGAEFEAEKARQQQAHQPGAAQDGS